MVNALKGKPEKPPANLTTDGNDSMLQDADAVADRWYQFLAKKFRVTEEESQRPAVSTLPCTQGVDDLTPAEIARGITKMKSNKACGPDEIPIEVFKSCPACMAVLTELLHKIWNSEDVPAKFAQATFIMT